MRAQLQGSLPLTLVALVALTLGGLLVRVRYQLEVVREKQHLHELLDSLSAEIGAQLYSGEEALASEPPRAVGGWHPWHLSAADYRGEEGRALPIVKTALQRALAGAAASSRAIVLGPFSTDDARNALVLARAVPRSRTQPQWVGEWQYLDDIMSPQRLAKVVTHGYWIQLYDASQATVLYQSDEGDLDAPAVAVQIAGSSLQLRAAPRSGWTVPLRVLSPSFLVLLAITLWLSYEVRRSGALHRAAARLQAAEGRHKHLSAQYGSALESLAALESRLQLITMYDTATGLANRSALVRRIEATLGSIRQSQHGTLWVMAIGFDHMHHIASSFGAEFASRALIIAAERMEFLLPSKDLLFRTGDFRLAVALSDVARPEVESLTQRLLDEVDSPIAVGSHTFLLHPRIGIAQTSSGYDYADTLLDHANAALDAVTREVTSRWSLYDSTTPTDSIDRLQLEADLERAFAENQFVLEYEPFIIAADNQVAGFEALVRWDHPTEGRLLPGRFLSIALQARMSHRLNAWVLHEAARQVSLWRRAGHRDLFVNFNLTADAFLQPELADQIGAALAEFDLPGNQLVIELTEATLVQDIRATTRTLQRLSELGVNVWLDDFGTGYSSLSHLRTLPLKGVKIDRSFIERIEIDSRDFGFVKALIDLISYLGMQSIAEGIETFAQYELLNLTSCELYQGYFFARSMPAEAAERWMRERVGHAQQAVRA
ncbi:MAG TPA: phosphodiesterase [Steroidobacteraceae bacterium]|nr:phosphodiesterase [Steroidobacteraceae bacterium]